MITSTDRQIELERKDAAKEALEMAAQRLESFSTNEVYKRALKIGAKLVRDMAKSNEPLRNITPKDGKSG